MNSNLRHQHRARRVAASVLLSAACLATVEAAARWYVGVAVGGNASRDVVLESRSNDRASICDEYINPRALAVPGCTTPDRGAGDGWLAPFDPGTGFSTETEIGFRMSPRYRIAAVYAHNATDFDQTVSSTDAKGADFDKLGNELSIGEETLGAATSDEILLVVYRDWTSPSRWTPYVGIGAAVARTRKDLSWLWARSADPANIATGLGQPNADEIRRNLAGTVSTGRRTIRDATVGYVLVAGIDRQLSDSVSAGLKAQWKRFEAFESDAYSGDLLRSHRPNIRLDGSEPVSAWSRTSDTGRFSVLFTLRYALQ